MKSGQTASSRWARWWVYGFAVTVTVATLLLRMNMGVAFGQRPLLILFVLPIILSAYLGGLGPGLVSTLVAALGVDYFLMPPTQNLFIAMKADLTQWIMLIVTGICISVLVEFLHRSRRQAEESRLLLLQSEGRYRLLIETTGTGFVSVDKHGLVVDANQEYVRLTGHNTLAEILGRSVLELTAAEVQERNAREVNKCLEQGWVRNLEINYRNKDGQSTPIEINASVIENGGNPVILILCRDITGRKKAEKALHKNRDSLERINSCLLELGTDHDANINRLTALAGELLSATCALYNRLEGGCLYAVGQWQTPPDFKTMDAPEGHICYDVIRNNRDDVLLVTDLLHTSYAESDPNVRAYGLQTYMGLVVKSAGKPVGSLCVVFQTDVQPCEDDRRILGIIAAAIGQEDERKHVEAALRESEERFQAFMNNNPAIAWAKDEAGRYVYLSEAYEKRLGVRLADWRGKTDPEVWPPETAEEFRKNDLAVLASDQVMEFIEQAKLAGDLSSWLIFKFPFRDAAGKRYVGGVGLDITERQQAEATIKASLREKEVLLKEIYHRTKNNLQVVISLLNMQSSRFSDPQLVQAFQDSGNRIRSMALVHEKLYQSNDLSHIDLKDYIKALANSLLLNYQTQSGKISLHLDLQNGTVNIETAMPCGLVINELVSNAIKYAFPGERQGTISIVLKPTADGDIELRVADDGVGLPPELDIWNTNSLGLKLAINLAQHQLQGKMEIRREQGTEFRIIFRELDYKPRI